MKIVIQKEIGVARLDIIKLKEELKKETPFKAIMNSFEIEGIPNEVKDAWLEHIYAEIDWGLFWRYIDSNPNKNELLVKIHPVQVEGQPVLKKRSVDVSKETSVIKLDTVSTSFKDWMLIGERILDDKDAWIDMFVRQRLYDPIHSDWKEIEIRGT